MGKIGKKYKKIIDSLDYAEYSDVNDADYVIISTPHKNHYDIGMKCLMMGYRTLVEKPMSMEKEEYQELSDAGAVTAFSKRYHGKINASKSIYWHANYLRDDSFYEGWRGEYDHILWNQCIHDFDLLIWSFGMPDVVWAKSDKRNIQCHLDFNGVVCEYKSTTEQDWETEFILDGDKDKYPRNYHNKLIHDFLNDNLEKPTIDVVNLIEELL